MASDILILGGMRDNHRVHVRLYSFIIEQIKKNKLVAEFKN
ncbi:hypothetical protein OMAG_001075 [Candidatus Omnitrophus magneticus]|uniref:Uncharacterized protein n=1 Tax=Candidatus Omnitrophus magneticus TaxID=1609969 RepID=A0A0F0CU96_9BACT|nr:hypothetical protein OMAG_001075 [Candidatus Omnitrophus magneticus]